jgi:phospholipid transport system substrate-binding protein
MLMKRLVVFLFVLIAAAGISLPTAAKEQAMVQAMVDEVVLLLSNKNLDREGRLKGLRGLFSKYMDLPFVGRFVLGRHWRPLDAGKQAEYTAAFEDYVINIYAKRLDGYSGETINVSGARAVNDQDTLVSSELRRAEGPPVSLEWRVRQLNGAQKIIDVTVEGVSMAISQREEFSSYLQQHSIDNLIARLKQESAN